MSAKDGFVIYKSFYKPISRLSDKQLGRLFRAIFNYQLDGEATVEEDIEMAFEFFKNQFEIDELKYKSIVERNRSNGRKNVKEDQPKQNPMDAKPADKAKQPSGTQWDPTDPKEAKQPSGGLKDKEKEKDKGKINLPPQRAPEDDEEEEDLRKKIDYYKQKQIWKSDICKKFGISSDQTDALLEEFYLDMRCNEINVRKVSSLFISWLKQKISTQNEQSNTNKPRARGSGLRAKLPPQPGHGLRGSQQS